MFFERGVEKIQQPTVIREKFEDEPAQVTVLAANVCIGMRVGDEANVVIMVQESREQPFDNKRDKGEVIPKIGY